ncbi:conserved hypothetical protein [Paenibacillus curdlanolyticus YK9]|uniref:HNH domain-containing protein n=1 Tax=Paenibacillus curdlanolyticus YK9 TaxID=717606 RepID=E0ID74_9BACL|nr:HNH endonuclease [Paenibacillus curdlanolyticus]EFM09529.1 conserved hypothetical protein [Paenibacillus curdlanolyticus YK9]
MPIFSSSLRKHFQAEIGAYSTVTRREATGDKSVTVDANEKSVIHSVYPSDTFARKGGVASNSSNATHRPFILHTETGMTKQVELSVVYPKRKGEELRLYFSKKEGFEAEENDIWFIFVREGEEIPHVGTMSSQRWGVLMDPPNTKTVEFLASQALDDEDDVYQKEVGAAAVELPTETTVLRYPRKASVALEALEKARYCCEVDPTHKTFIGVSGKPFMECHHLIPISLQGRFSVSLDICENIVSLCPTCHRLLHYSSEPSKLEVLGRLWDSRRDGLEKRGVLLERENFLQIYAPAVRS